MAINAVISTVAGNSNAVVNKLVAGNQNTEIGPAAAADTGYTLLYTSVDPQL